MKTSPISKLFLFDAKSSNCYGELKESTDIVKEKLLNIPKPPFLKFDNNNYTIVCDPEGLFYSEDKKNTCIIIKPYTQDVLRQLSQIANIVLFSKKKMKSMEPFLLQTSHIPYAGVLDKQYETYKQGRRVKDLKKLGCTL